MAKKLKKLLWYTNLDKDVFGNKKDNEEWTKDHIWPKNKKHNGSLSKENILFMSFESNKIKSNNLTGHVNGIEFIVKEKLTKNGKIIGILEILKDKEWFEVKQIDNMPKTKKEKLTNSQPIINKDKLFITSEDNGFCLNEIKLIKPLNINKTHYELHILNQPLIIITKKEFKEIKEIIKKLN